MRQGWPVMAGYRDTGRGPEPGTLGQQEIEPPLD